MKLSLLLAALLALPARAADVARDAARPVPGVTLSVGPALNAPALPGLALPSAGVPTLAALPSAVVALPQAVAARAESTRVETVDNPAAPEAKPRTRREKIVARRGAELRAAFTAGVEDPEAADSLDAVSVKPDPNKAYTASPEDWRDEILYSILLDRFARGPHAQPEGDPKSGLTRHGGDLQGVTGKLDYLERSGVTTLLLSPVTKTVPEAYHGYAPVHFMAVDPHLGTLADFRKLVSEAHARGLRVVLDLVVNHAGPVFEYEGGPQGSGWAPMDEPRKKIGYWTAEPRPVELTDPDRFTRRGVIDNWDDQAQATHGDFPPNYRHLSTEDRRTQDDLIKIASWWIKETDIDGFRLDAIRHVDQGFLERFDAEIKAYAAGLGKENFLLLGEDSTGVDGDLNDKLAKGLDTLYNYPEFRRVLYALHGKAPTRQLEDSLHASTGALGGAAARLVRFIDLHDTYRFLREGEHPDYLKIGFAWLLFSIGVPLVYYGTEQAFRTSHGRLDPENGALPADPENRQDMFARFDADAPSFQYLSRLAELRRQHPQLRRGRQFVRWSDPHGPGLYAFSRLEAGQEAVVATNTAEQARAATMYVDAEHSPAGTVFQDALDPSYTVTAFAPAGGGSQLAVEVPPRGVRVLVKKP